MSVDSEQRGDDGWGWWGAGAVLLGAGWYLPTEASLRGGLGMPLVVGWLVWAAALAFARWRGLAGADVAVRWQWADAAWLGLVAWMGLSVAVGLAWSSLEPRPALALAWQYLSLAVVYVGVRVVGRGVWEDVVVRGMVALAVSLAVFAGFQYAVALPALHRQYELADEATKVAMLVGAGIVDTQPGSRMRELFESRLFNREPFAAFSLANTLGTVLVPATVLAWVGLHLGVERRRWASALGWGLAWAVLGGAMALTSSRTALLACALVSMLWWLGRRATGWRWRWLGGGVEPRGEVVGREIRAGQRGRWWIGLLVGFPLVLLAGLWSAGRSDSQLFSGAPASVQYRWQYWVASAEMIVARPWFGCGPGNFQSAYARYQAAEASETVADPHNFFFELAATAGLPAGLLVCVAIALTLAAVPSSLSDRAMAGEGSAGRSPLGWGGPWIVLLSALGLGLGVGWLGEAWPSPLWALMVAALAASGWWWLMELDPRPAGVAGAGLAWAWGALLLSLLASGGINYPVIGQLVFGLAALTVTAGEVRWWAEQTRKQERRVAVQRSSGSAGRGLWGVVAAAALGLAVYLYAWETLPVIRAQWAMQNAQVGLRLGSLPAAQQGLRTVRSLDPWRADAPLELAVLDLVSRAGELADGSVQREVSDGLRRAAALRPDSNSLRRRVGEAYLQCLVQLSSRSPARGWLWSEAEQWLREAAERKSVEREVLAQLSWLAWRAGRAQEARALAERVRDLASRNVHADLAWERQWFIALQAELPLQPNRPDAAPVEAVANAAGQAGSEVSGAGASPLEFRSIRGGLPGMVEVNVAGWVEWLLATESAAEVTAK